MQQTEAHVTPALVTDKVTKIYTRMRTSQEKQGMWKRFFNPEKEKITALKDLSIQVDKGEFVAYAGANGAGKSTTLKILSGILQPTTGEVRVLGLHPSKDRIQLMKRIGVLFGQRTELWWDQSVLTSYHWKKAVWDIPDTLFKENLETVTQLLDLEKILPVFSRELSLGQRMRADLGMLLLHSPELIFLDEPTLGLDVLAKRQMINFLKKLNKELGTTIIVTSHDMDDLEEMAQRIILLSEGELIYDGSFQDFRQGHGGVSEITLWCEGTAPVLKGLKFTHSQGKGHTYVVEDAQGGLGEILAQIALLDKVEDLEIKKSSLEEIVAQLYTQLKEKAPPL